jgi:penicillin-binding protein-related factor A (putative recombinase)
MARLKGLKWERVCENSRHRLAQNGDLCWFPFYPPTLKIGTGTKQRRGSFLAVYTGKAPPDWIALADGLSILGEDKDSRSERWSTRQIKPHQAAAFDAHENQGGLSVILLRHHDRSRWVIPWQCLKPLWVDKKTLTITDLQNAGFLQWQTRETDEPAPYDWFVPLMKWRAENGR